MDCEGMHPLGARKSAAELLDMYYLDMRSALLETAAALDRIQRANGAEAIFADPRIHIFTSSSVGIPFEVDFDSVIATAGDGTQEILDIYDGNTLHILAPGLDKVGDTVNTHIHINNTTSNINDFCTHG